MQIQISKDQLIALSEGKVINCGDQVLSASKNMKDICCSILKYPWMTKNYGIFLEKDLYSWVLFLKNPSKRRRRKRVK